MRRTIFAAEHDEFRAAVRDFLEREVVPEFPRWLEEHIVPRQLFRDLAKLDILSRTTYARLAELDPLAQPTSAHRLVTTDGVDAGLDQVSAAEAEARPDELDERLAALPSVAARARAVADHLDNHQIGDVHAELVARGVSASRDAVRKGLRRTANMSRHVSAQRAATAAGHAAGLQRDRAALRPERHNRTSNSSGRYLSVGCGILHTCRAGSPRPPTTAELVDNPS